MARNILLFGPQGSGKGTQGERLSVHLGLPFIVTGNIFREHIKNNTVIGQEIKSFIKAGKLVPDHVTKAVINDRLQKPDCQAGFILDGYPRNLIQAEALDKITTVTHLIYIALSDASAIDRIAGRRTCVAAGHVYHIKHNPPKQMGLCDQDGSALLQRDDDTEAALQKRLEIYHQDTEPVLEHYQTQGVVHTVHGEETIITVWEEVKAIFA
ncbi:MAG: nucleoside monophosphate kinase [Patescibacteria group bacterium]|jgi:adenylate kinase